MSLTSMADQSYIERLPIIVAWSSVPARGHLLRPNAQGGRAIGAIAIYRQEVRPFTDKQIDLVQNFANQAVIAIENARLLNELRERTTELARSVEELRALGDVSQAVNSTLDLETVLSTIVAKAVQLSGTEAGAIYEFDEQQQEFRLRSTYGMDEKVVDEIRDHHIGMGETTIERGCRSAHAGSDSGRSERSVDACPRHHRPRWLPRPVGRSTARR